MIPVLTEAFNRMMVDQYYSPSMIQTDEIISEVVPRYHLWLKIPYIRFDREYAELRIGFYHRHIFSWGKKTVQRRAYIWESKKKSVLKIKRFNSLKPQEGSI